MDVEAKQQELYSFTAFIVKFIIIVTQYHVSF